jgi:GNAT superfamily N-acetyltransferase
MTSECAALTGLATRSKAYWGYDAAFMLACQDELAVTPDQIGKHLIVADLNGSLAGFAFVNGTDTQIELGAMYVEPGCIGKGVGRSLFEWCAGYARSAGAREMLIDADPNAEAFYIRQGAVRFGLSPSESIPGRMLPQLVYRIR